MTEDERKYMQAVNRQQWDRAPNRVRLIERLEDDTTRMTTYDNRVVTVMPEQGKKIAPIAICGRTDDAVASHPLGKCL